MEKGKIVTEALLKAAVKNYGIVTPQAANAVEEFNEKSGIWTCRLATYNFETVELPVLIAKARERDFHLDETNEEIAGFAGRLLGIFSSAVPSTEVKVKKVKSTFEYRFKPARNLIKRTK